MHSKRHLIVQGACIPSHQPGEDVTLVFIDSIAKKVGIWIRPDDIGQVHQLGNGFIAKFINRMCGSPFMRLLRVQPNHDLQINMRLIPEDKKIFNITATEDYHDDMDGKTFELWLGHILPMLPPGSVVVMDNASYHTTKVCFYYIMQCTEMYT
jgi:hypothetical protein